MNGIIETTNTNVQVNTKLMEDFKQVLKDQGYRLQKGFEVALVDYVKKHNEKPKNESLLKALS